ncbi:hypothetical protein [Nocardia farcinica]|uniref:hypothetical protein n=1 Tax=Nocardia farcinica TaxID=37329 RepID=UPI0018937E78|nr:hypothetical protein [Nocardia farcinica]MBF6445971.1 hypothetical protein [Nocardia farcinica]
MFRKLDPATGRFSTSSKFPIDLSCAMLKTSDSGISSGLRSKFNGDLSKVTYRNAEDHVWIADLTTDRTTDVTQAVHPKTEFTSPRDDDPFFAPDGSLAFHDFRASTAHTSRYTYVDPTTFAVIRTEDVPRFGSLPGPLRTTPEGGNQTCSDDPGSGSTTPNGVILSMVGSEKNSDAILVQYTDKDLEANISCYDKLFDKRLSPVTQHPFEPIFQNPDGSDVWFANPIPGTALRVLYKANRQQPDSPITVTRELGSDLPPTSRMADFTYLDWI